MYHFVWAMVGLVDVDFIDLDYSSLTLRMLAIITLSPNTHR